MVAAPPSGGEQDPLDRIVVALVRHEVDFIAIGGWAVRAQRYDLGRVTYDVDVTPERSRENLQRLSEALDELGAEVRFGDETLAFSHDAESLARAAVWNLSCRHGDFDVCFEPSGIEGGYDELADAAHTVAIEVDEETVPVRCADLADIVRSKETADRFKDREDLAVLVQQLEGAKLTAAATTAVWVCEQRVGPRMRGPRSVIGHANQPDSRWRFPHPQDRPWRHPAATSR